MTMSRVDDTDAVQARLDAVQGKATKRILTVEDIQAIAGEAEAYLETLGVARRARRGHTVLVRRGGHTSGGWTTTVTVAELTRNTVGWRLAYVGRRLSDERGGWIMSDLTDDALASIRKMRAYRSWAA
jgi:hypothetical protein